MLRRFTCLISLAGMLIVSCGSSEQVISVEDAWVRQIQPSQSVTAGYMKIDNKGAAEDRLLSVTSPAFDAVELHEMAIDRDSVMRMRKSGPLTISPGQSLTLKRGGFHLMLIGPRYAIAAGNDIPLMLTFEVAGEIAIPARVRAD
jgi:copper(I)-binding protein